MLTAARIEQLAWSGQDDRLIEALLANGREAPLSSLLLMSDPGGRRAAALGLAAQRLAELTHGSGQSCQRLTTALLDEQKPSGGFGTTAGTIAALAGLLTYVEYPGAEPLTDQIRQAAERSLTYLASRQDERGLIDSDAAISLLAARMLMRYEGFLSHVRFGELVEALMRSEQTATEFAGFFAMVRSVLSAA